jgi:hypothetical protein
MKTAVIYEGPTGIRVETDSVSISGAGPDEIVRVARERVAAGADRIELCGGLGAIDYAEVKAALRSDARTGLNRYGFESLEAIAAYKEAYARGESLTEAFVYLSAGADPQADRVVHGGTTFIAVPDDVAVGSVAAELGDAGVGLIELYAGLGAAAAAVALEATHGKVPVGFVGYDDRS